MKAFYWIGLFCWFFFSCTYGILVCHALLRSIWILAPAYLRRHNEEVNGKLMRCMGYSVVAR